MKLLRTCQAAVARTREPLSRRLSQPPSAQAHYTIHTSVLGTFVLSCVSCLCDRHKWGCLGERAPCSFREESVEIGNSLLDPSLLFCGRLVNGSTISIE